jgi:hypothetical protein
VVAGTQPSATRTELIAPPVAAAKPKTGVRLAIAAGVVVVALAAVYGLAPRLKGDVPNVVALAPSAPASTHAARVAASAVAAPPAASPSVVEVAASSLAMASSPVNVSAPTTVSVPVPAPPAAVRVASAAAPLKKAVPVAVSAMDGRWSGYYLCSEMLIPSKAKNRGAFKADVVLQVSGKNIVWTRRGDKTFETMSGQVSGDGRWTAEGVGQNSERRDSWLSTAKGVLNRKVSPARFDGDMQILSADRATLFRKCTMTAVRDPA